MTWEIATITIEQLDQAIDGLRTKKTDSKGDKEAHDPKNQQQEWKEEIDISKIAYPLHSKLGVGGEIVGENPIHRHKNKKNEGKTNFSINTNKNVWYCFSCNSGGGWVEWLAVREGIIRCEDAGPNCLTREQYIQVIRVAENEGLIKPYQPRRHEPVARNIAKGDALSDVQVFEKFPDIPTPRGMTAVHAAPRNGKTHEAVNRMKSEGEGNYFSHNHAVVGHAFRIFRDLGGESAVWLEGKTQPGMCRFNFDSCANCPLKPNEHRPETPEEAIEKETGIGYFEMKEKAAQLLREKRF